MFHIFSYTRLATFSNSDEVNRLRELLAGHNIRYRIKTKDASSGNVYDKARIGISGNNTITFSYIVYVRKEDLKYALPLLAQLRF